MTRASAPGPTGTNGKRQSDHPKELTQAECAAAVSSRIPADDALERDGTETELKFLLDDASYKAAREAKLLGGKPQSAAQHLRTVYFDTDAQDLSRCGMTVRVRTRRGQNVMTFKAATTPGATLFTRREYEVPLSGDTPDSTLFPAEVSAELARVTRGQALRPAFSTEIQRLVRHLHHRHSQIEVALDRGVIAGGNTKEAVLELELELKSGEPSDLFALGLDVIDTLPARLGVLSKAERAAAFVSDAGLEVVRAKSSLTPEDNVDHAIGAVIAACIHQFIGNWPVFERNGDPEAVHQMRVAMRRLRAALALFQRSFPNAEFVALRSEARRLASAMGDARNWDVFIEMLQDGPNSVSGDDRGYQALLAACEEHRKAGYEKVAALLRDPATSRFVLSAHHFVAHRGWRTGLAGPELPRLTAPASAFAAEHLDRLRRRVRRRGRDIMTLASDERHEVRIALKGLRYATDFFGALFPDAVAVKTYARATSRLQDVLGSFNDMSMATDMVQQLHLGGDLSATRAAGVVLGWYGRAAQSDVTLLGDAWQAFRRVKPFWTSALPADAGAN